MILRLCGVIREPLVVVLSIVLQWRTVLSEVSGGDTASSNAITVGTCTGLLCSV